MNDEIKSVTFTPVEAGTRAVAHVKNIQDNRHRSMPFPIGGEIGRYFADLLPTNTVSVLAQTSNYKTGFMNYWEQSLARHLVAQGRQDEVIIRIDTENTIEELGMMRIAQESRHTMADLARGNVRDWGAVIKAANKMKDVPIYRIANPIGDENAPELYMSNNYRAVQYIRNGGLTGKEMTVACIFVDYLQALPIDPEVKREKVEVQRRLQVRQDVYRIKKMAQHFACPVVFGVQAKQTLSVPPPIQIPGLYDGEETSAIAQRADRQLSLWMPKMTHPVGSYIKFGGTEFEVTENMIWVKVLKQRGGLPSGKMWPCEIDYETGNIRTVEL